MRLYQAFLGENFKSPRHNYFYRNKYKAHAHDNVIGLNSDKLALQDYHFGEMILYGKVDRNHMPICLTPDRPDTVTSKFKQIKSSINPDRPATVLNFVADSFEAFVAEFKKGLLCGKIDSDHPYLSNPRAYYGNISYDFIYTNWQRQIAQAFIQSYLPTLDDVLEKRFIFTNFDKFVDQLMIFFRKLVRTMPITLNGFMRSRMCPPHVSGLTIDIADLDNSIDQEKYDIFISSRNYQFFLKAAFQHGFYVDQFVPWRLYANVNSDVMKEAIHKAQGHVPAQSVGNMFGMNYEYAHNRGYELFKRYILNLYYTHHLFKPYHGGYTTCRDGTTISKVEKLTPISRNIIFSHKNELYFLKLYTAIRNVEEESKFTTAEVNQMALHASQLASTKHISHALLYLESRLSENRLKTGSLTDLEKNLNLIDERKDATIRAVSNYPTSNLANVESIALGENGPAGYDFDHHDDESYSGTDLGEDPYDL